MKTYQQAVACLLALLLTLSLLPITALTAMADPAGSASNPMTEASTENLLITFDPNGDGATCEVKTARTNKYGCLDELPVPTWKGHVFTGWFTERKQGDPVDKSFVFYKARTIYAHWDGEATAENLIITFDANGGSCDTTSARTNKYGHLDELPTATREKHRFLGWFSRLTDGDPITTTTFFYMESTVYAHWLELFKVVWKNGSQVLKTEQVGKDETPRYSGADPTKAGNAKQHYVFTGWNDGTATYKPSALPAVTADVTFTAAFRAEDHSFTAAVTTKPTCTRDGVKTLTCACGYSYTEKLAALGHNWKDPTFVFSQDKTTATATRVCKRDQTHTETKTAAVTSVVTKEATLTEDGLITYTATVVFDGKTYTATRTSTVPALGRTNPFVDVKEKDYFYDAVLWAFYHDPQITKGTDATHFGPSLTCMRQDIVTFLWRANGCPEPTTSNNPFTDVAPSKYYYKAVLWAVENGITEGTGRTTFSPKRGCTRAEVVTFLWRANHKPKPAAARNPFTDVLSSKYYYKAVLWAVENGITAGTSKTKFSPNDTCTRAQIVTFLYRALN